MKAIFDETPAVKLDKYQMRFVNCTAKHVAVFANAGAGKTTAIQARYLELLKNGIPPKEILLTTFTNDGTTNLKNHVDSYIGYETASICTLDSVCKQIVDSAKINCLWFSDENPYKLENRDAPKKNDRKLEEFKSENPEYIQFMLASSGDEDSFTELLSKAKSTTCDSKNEETVCDVLVAAKKNHKVDFTDLKHLALYCMENCTSIADAWSNKFQVIIIDEFQDIDFVQYSVIKKLITEETILYIVGDPNQSAYTWRGSDSQIMRDFKKDFPDAEIIHFPRTYRCSRKVCKLVNRIMRGRADFAPIQSMSDAESEITYNEFFTNKDEAEYVYSKAKALIEKGVSPSEIAVLVRINTQCKELNRVCSELNITIDTIHALKGNEYKYVFLCGLNNYLFPSRFSMNTNLTEENNLFYIAITRTKKDLYLTSFVKLCKPEDKHRGHTDRYYNRSIFINRIKDLVTIESLIEHPMSVAKPENRINPDSLEILSPYYDRSTKQTVYYARSDGKNYYFTSNNSTEAYVLSESDVRARIRSISISKSGVPSLKFSSDNLYFGKLYKE